MAGFRFLSFQTIFEDGVLSSLKTQTFRFNRGNELFKASRTFTTSHAYGSNFTSFPTMRYVGDKHLASTERRTGCSLASVRTFARSFVVE